MADPKQISEFPTAGAPSATDWLLIQQGATGTPLAKIAAATLLDTPHSTLTLSGTAVVGGAVTMAALSATTGTFSSTATATAFIPSSATVPTNGMYLPAANTLGWAINSAAEMSLTASALSPAVSDGSALGTSALMWSDAFFASGAVLNFANGGVTLTHSADRVTLAGGDIRITRNSTSSSGSTYNLLVDGDQSVAHTGTFYGGSFGPTYSAASGNTLSALYALHSAPSNDSTGTITALQALRALPTNASTGAVTSMVAINARPTNSAGGAVSVMYGLAANLINSSTGTVTTAYGLYSALNNVNAGGTVTTYYGAYLATASNSGTLVTNWGLYQQDTAAKNALLGRTLIGGLTDDASTELQVNGSSKVTGYRLRGIGNALTAAGTTRADALQLAAEINRVSTAASGTGVILPVGVVGMVITVLNAGANLMKVYASASETIDGTAGSNGVSLSAAARCDYIFTVANTWISALRGATSA